MSTKNDGGPAFPLTGTQWNPDRDAHEVSPVDTGMTLRDWFAGKAMAAVPMRQGDLHDIPEAYDRIAAHAYKLADAMLKARGE